VRTLRWRGSTDTPEDRIRFLANGSVIGTAAVAMGIAGETVVALTRPAGVLPWQELPLVAIAFGVAVGAALLAGFAAAAAASRTSALRAVPGTRPLMRDSLPTLVDDVVALVPPARRPMTALFERPRLLVTAFAGVALAGVFVSQVGGRPFTHHASILLPALALAALEALCVLAGYLAVGRSLGLRGHRAGSAERARA
jgi:hypothetical protein